MSNNLYIEVKVYGGAPPRDTFAEMVALADLLRISIWCEFNGVRTLARVGDDPDKIMAAWERELASNHHPKVASS